jgi:anion-transporting  ArsA/GET3 family ATPase
MTSILVFTGNAGPGIATAAAATAIRLAERGSHTLLFSFAPAHSLSALLGVPIGDEPTPIAARLDGLALDTLAALAAAWERGRKNIPTRVEHIAGDELPLLPGLEISFGLLRLRELAPRYDAVVLDAGPHDMLLRALALPDGLRWTVRQLFGLDRGPGRSSASVGRALLPTSLMPAEALASIQDIRVQAERLRELLNTPGATARYVMRADRPALEEARLAIPALQLHGLAIPALAIGPLLPEGLEQTSLAGVVSEQHAIFLAASQTWPTRKLGQFNLHNQADGLKALSQIGSNLEVSETPPAASPIVEQWEGAPAVAIELPGLPNNALQLTLSSDELIVRIGAYRRHILLPEALRGATNIKATREGERLIIRLRNP